MIRRTALGTLLLFALNTNGSSAGIPSRSAPRDVSELLAPIIKKHDIPGMVGAVVDMEGVVAVGAAGVRKRGRNHPIREDDLFHLGSCTKSMTATLAAVLVEEGRLSWKTTVGEAFASARFTVHPEWRPVTLEQLLAHRGGAPERLSDAQGVRIWAARNDNPVRQRETLSEFVLSMPPDSSPGSRYAYSNIGYALAGAIMERIVGDSWENLMRTRLFDPLKMVSAGFGAPGSRGSSDHPRGHTEKGIPEEPGPDADLPAAYGPADSVHCSIEDWGRYLSLHLKGARGEPTFLRYDSFAKLHAPAPGPGAPYALGWGLHQRWWAKGRILSHGGSNLRWYCVVWAAPGSGFAVLVACNQGGPEALKAIDEAAGALILEHVNRRR